MGQHSTEDMDTGVYWKSQCNSRLRSNPSDGWSVGAEHESGRRWSQEGRQQLGPEGLEEQEKEFRLYPQANGDSLKAFLFFTKRVKWLDLHFI